MWIGIELVGWLGWGLFFFWILDEIWEIGLLLIFKFLVFWGGEVEFLLILGNGDLLVFSNCFFNLGLINFLNNWLKIYWFFKDLIYNKYKSCFKCLIFCYVFRDWIILIVSKYLEIFMGIFFCFNLLNKGNKIVLNLMINNLKLIIY